MARRVAEAAFLLALIPPVFAARADELPKPPPVWSGKAEASYVATSGNSDAKTLGAAGEVLYVPGIWNFKLAVGFIRSESDGTESARSLDCLFRAARKLNPRLEIYGQATYRENRFSGIDHQWAGEVGAAYQFLNADPHSVKVEAGLGYTKEVRIVPSGTEDRGFSTARVGVEYKWKLSKTAEFSDELSFTEDLKDSKDWRFTDKLSLSASLTTLLSVKLSYVRVTLNDPPPSKRKTDTITSAALVAKF